MFIFISCQEDETTVITPEIIDSLPSGIVIEEEVTLNPSGYAPLSAMISLTTSEIVRVRIRVLGKNGEDSDVVKDFPELGTTLQIPVHGLYADFQNSVRITFFNSDGVELGIKTYIISTNPLIADMPMISIETAKRDLIAKGMTMVNYYGYSQNVHPFRPFMFDAYGDIRWYLDYINHPDLNNLHYDNGPHRLANGNFYFANREPDAIYEVDLFGTIVNTWDMPGYRFHHEVFEKPNGNFLVSVDKYGESTIEDYIIEIDRNSKEVINEWNLNQSLDNQRTTLTDNAIDWIHVNGVSYDPFDDSIIISGRTQGVVKLTADNEVVWIMGAHKGWSTAGNGIDLTQFLLQPLDATGVPITSHAVLNGDENHLDFEWNWYQHATKVMPDGNIILFDNGFNRNFSEINTYSRAVSYKINTENRTIQQVWQYGKERGTDTYSRIVSDVDYLEAENHMLFSPGNIVDGARPVGKSIEVDMITNEVVFEATVIPPKAFVNKITFHRTERLLLYPD
ncbi:aryl-sulfate sulfotransferase [uncultured Aquimarina sp.]|uniref:aryl-sulfate sulfotransferase n=1 Tax=uncultured Aquimarina sp. TaxID=575652 RepID=UPI00260BDE4F|nr:aryl-sulfate sulfotransferase [uncultured Aquimarina sp.]